MSVWDERVADAAEDTRSLNLRLRMACLEAGHDDIIEVCEAIGWASLQLDPEADDYETWEATVLARLENPNSGER